jgi:hypothetical protein
MPKLRMLTIAAVAALLATAGANAAQMHKSRASTPARVQSLTEFQATRGTHFAWGSYEDYRGFNHTPALYSFAYVPTPNAFAPPLTVTSFPMPFTAWW